MCIDLPLLRNCFVERVFWVWCPKQSLYAEEDGSDLKSWGPVVLENIKTDSAQSVDVGVIDAGQKSYAWRAHGIVVWQKKLELEDAT